MTFLKKKYIKSIVFPKPICQTYKVIKEVMCDNTCFTQGICYNKNANVFYQSCGGFGNSHINVNNIDEVSDSINIKTSFKLKDEEFAEGICLLNNFLYLITWKSKTAYKYQIEDENLSEIESFGYVGEGWGLASNNKGELIMSNGTDILQVFNSEFYPLYQIKITHPELVISNINALCYHNNKIYANIWYNNNIFIINPKNGQVINYIDLNEITSKNREGVLNGITFINNIMVITGKNWGKYYYLQLDDNLY